MAEQHTRSQQQQMQVGHPTEAIKSLLPQSGPSKSQVLAVVTLFPVGGALLCLAGLTLAGTLIGLALATPVFLLFSPVLVPASLMIALAVTGFLTSGAFGITALSSLSWMINYMRRMRAQLESRWSMQSGGCRILLDIWDRESARRFKRLLLQLDHPNSNVIMLHVVKKIR